MQWPNSGTAAAPPAPRLGSADQPHGLRGRRVGRSALIALLDRSFLARCRRGVRPDNIWETGEADIETVRLADGQAINKHCELASGADLDTLIGEVLSLLRDGVTPPDAFNPCRPNVGRPALVAAAGRAAPR